MSNQQSSKDRITESINKDSENEPVVNKPLKPEEKPFQNFIIEDLIPDLIMALDKQGISKTTLKLIEGNRPVVGGKCWMVFGQLPNERRFWLCFASDSISSMKNIAIAEADQDPDLLESFLIDEKKTTKSLLVSRLLQRLNGQKWLGAN